MSNQEKKREKQRKSLKILYNCSRFRVAEKGKRNYDSHIN